MNITYNKAKDKTEKFIESNNDILFDSSKSKSIVKLKYAFCQMELELRNNNYSLHFQIYNIMSNVTNSESYKKNYDITIY